jgi:membrane protein implicated in regulation of membrane protease activity
MDMSASTLWWVAGGILVAAELATGTFYLLMLAVGTAAGAIAAHLGLGSTAQIIATAVVGGAAVVAWHLNRPHGRPAERNPDVSLDIGQVVQVEQWNADGSATVRYRGSDWQARWIGGGAPGSGRHVIRAVEGSCLLLGH